MPSHSLDASTSRILRISALARSSTVEGDGLAVGAEQVADVSEPRHNLRMHDSEMIGARWWYENPTHVEQLRALLGKSPFNYPGEAIEQCLARKTLNPLAVRELNWNARRWLEARLAEPFDGRTVVVTHHPPSFQAVLLAREANLQDTETWNWRCNPTLLSPTLDHSRHVRLVGYGKERFPEAARGIDLWIHGHLHHGLFYLERGVPVIANPRGHGYEKNLDFMADRVVDLDTLRPYHVYLDVIESSAREAREFLLDAEEVLHDLKGLPVERVRRRERAASVLLDRAHSALCRYCEVLGQSLNAMPENSIAKWICRIETNLGREKTTETRITQMWETLNTIDRFLAGEQPPRYIETFTQEEVDEMQKIAEEMDAWCQDVMERDRRGELGG